MIKFWLGIVGIVTGLTIGWLAYSQAPEDDFILESEWTMPPAPGSGPCGMGLGPCGMGMNQGKTQMGPGPGAGKDGMGQEMRQRVRQNYLEQIKSKDPKRYERISRIKQLAEQYRATEDPKKRQELEKQLRPLLEAELKAQQEDAKKRVADLEKRIARMKQILKQRDEHWNEVVEHNLKKITGQLDYLNFPPVPPQPPER